MMDSIKFLMCLDFDNTILDCNSDIEIKKVPGLPIPDEISSISSFSKFRVDGMNGWLDYMQAVFNFLHSNGVLKEQYVDALRQMPLVSGMQEMMSHVGESSNCEMVVISDCNTFFIDTVLGLQQLQVQAVLSNTAEFDNDDCLRIHPFCNQTHCVRCPTNMCKGDAMTAYIRQRLMEGISFKHVLYVGDGGNDICPALTLSEGDAVFPRKGFRLLKILEKTPAQDIKANVVPWDKGHDIMEYLLCNS